MQIDETVFPSMQELSERAQMQRVTVEFNKSTIDVFKHEAKKNNVPYQRMIRALTDHYVEWCKRQREQHKK